MPKDKKWEFPSYRFAANSTEKPVAKEVQEDAKPEPYQAERSVERATDVDPDKMKEFMLSQARRVAATAEKIDNQRRNDYEFREEVINFFSYLMDSVERVTGGSFPSKQQIISEMKSRYLKK